MKMNLLAVYGFDILEMTHGSWLNCMYVHVQPNDWYGVELLSLFFDDMNQDNLMGNFMTGPCERYDSTI